jgi:hypothetical protein
MSVYVTGSAVASEPVKPAAAAVTRQSRCVNALLDLMTSSSDFIA